MGFDVQKIKQKLFHRDSEPNEEDFIEEDEEINKALPKIIKYLKDNKR